MRCDMDDLVVGIDSSTTASKAIAWTAAGKAVAEGRADIAMASPFPNHYEQNPEDWWLSTCTALRHLCGQVDPARIKAISISNQRETLGYFRADGQAVRPGMVWLDERSRPYVDELADRLGKDADGTFVQHRISGKPVDIIPPSTRILWMLRQEPQNHARTEIFCGVHGYLTFRLTGDWRTSWASADPLGLFDMEKKAWAPEILSCIGLDESRLPVAQRPGSVLGEVSAAAAGQTGLLAGTPVIAGGGDGQLAGLGCAALEPETAYLNIGTALVSGVYGTRYKIGSAWRTMGSPTGEGYYYEACNRGGTFIVNWFLSTICGNDQASQARLLSDLEQECSKIPIGSQGLLMLPYWQGVMTPYWNASARGAFIGLSGAHGRAHMFRALMEGLAMEQHLCASTAEASLDVPVKTLVAIGGGATSNLWRQIFADVTGKVIARSDTVEASSLGAAICAAVGAGWFADFHSAASAMAGKIAAVSVPNPDAHARYGDLFALYRQMYERLTPLYAGIE
ncbi:MAG: hypothetical protein B7Z02_17090, partial [Rhodobacterales bacterium 32-67-9]